MARLRFPGRPGHRYGRSLVRYLPEKDRNRQHAFFARTAAIQRNLKWFYDLFGDSDEEDDFQGFTTSEIGDLPSPLKAKKWTKKEQNDPSLSPKIRNVKAAWPIMGRRAGREIHYTRRDSCAEMKRGEWKTDKPYKVKQSRVVGGRIQKLKQGKNANSGVGNREKRSVGRLSYRDMIRGLDVVRPKLIPPKVRLPKTEKGGMSPKKPTKFKIRLLGDGKQAKIVKGQGRSKKDTAMAWGKAKLEKAQQLLKKAKGKKPESTPTKYKPWEKKKLLLAQAQNGTVGKVGKVICVPKSKQVNMSKAMGLVKKAKDAQRKNQQVFGSDTPGKRSVKCSSKLTDMDIKGVDLHFLHRKVTPQKQAGLNSKRKLKLSGKCRGADEKTPKPPRPSFGFVMPVVSSRSSRVIKPTKRFIEQEEFGSSLFASPLSGNESGDWSDLPSDFEGSFLSPYSLQTPEISGVKKPSKTPKSDQTEHVLKSSEKKKTKQKDETTTFQDEFLKTLKQKKSSTKNGNKVKSENVRKNDDKVKSENETAKENSSSLEATQKRKEDKRLTKINVNVKNGIPLTTSQEEMLLGTTEAKWQSLRAVYKKIVKKDTLTEAEMADMRTSPLVLFQTIRTGEEILHIRGRIDGLPTVVEIMEKIKSKIECTPEETEKLNRYRRISCDRQAKQRSKQRAEKLIKKDGEAGTAKDIEAGTAEGIEAGIAKGIEAGTAKDIEAGTAEGIEAGTAKGIEAGTAKDIEAGTAEGIEAGTAKDIEAGTAEGIEAGTAKGIEASDGTTVNAISTSPRAKKKPELTEEEKAEQLELERERLMKKFLEEKEMFVKSVMQHREAQSSEGQPSMRALYRKVKEGLELAPDEMERMREDKLISNRRGRLRSLKKMLRKAYKDCGREGEVAILDSKEPEGMTLAGDSLALSPNSRRLLTLGSELYDEVNKQRVKKKKKKKKKIMNNMLSVGLGSAVPTLTKAERLQLKKKKKRKKGKDGKTKGDIKIRKKHASSKLLLKAKQRKHKGKGMKLKKSAARKLRLGDVLEEGHDSPSRLKSLLHDKLLSPADKTLQDTVSRQMADALEADMSPDQTEASNANARQVANEVTVGSVALSRGPRIKHVCRRASVALGYSPARYKGQLPSSQESLKLSALPFKERKQLFTSDGDSSETDTGSEGGRYSNETSPRLSSRKRKPTAKKRAMAGFISMDEEANYMEDNDDADFTTRRHPMKVPKVKKVPKQKMGMGSMPMLMTTVEEELNVKRRSRCGQCSACFRQFDCKKCANCLDKPKYGGRGTKKQACIHRKCHNLVKMKMMRLKRMKAAKQQMIGIPHQLEKVTTAVHRPAGARIKRAGGDVPIGLALVPKTKTGQTGDKDEKTEASSKALRTVKFSKKIPGKHLIKTDFKDDYNMSVAWKRGMVIISADPMIPRTICYLCGSNGKHELVYCNICCEPYHDFCLEEDERPLPDEKENWCCRNCRFCHVCDHQDKLLTCHKCHCSYHAECLGPNYPTKPSKKRKIWVCSRCVRCKSCGATTPGSDPKAQWMHGFSHCQECGKLFEKGNYCPVCKKCYEDDDFESKMMQCADCSRWVHAKCENLSDDQYRILTELPDSVPYRCPPCARHKPTPWKGEVDEELQAGFVNVLNALFSCKNAGHLIWPNRRFKYMRKVHQGESSRSSTGLESRESASSPAPSEASSLERETPTPDSARVMEMGGDGGTSSAQDDIEETYSFRRGRTVRRVLRRRRQQRSAGAGSDAGKANGAGKGDEEDGCRSRDSGREDVDVEEVGRTLRDGLKSENTANDVVIVDGENGQTHQVLDRDSRNLEGRLERTVDGASEESPSVSILADSDETVSSLSNVSAIHHDGDEPIVIDDEEDDALRTKKEKEITQDGPLSFSTTAQGDVDSSSESMPKNTSRESNASVSHVPKDDTNAERTTLFVSSSSDDIALTSEGDMQPSLSLHKDQSPPSVLSSAAKATAASLVEDQKLESQTTAECKDRTAEVPCEPTGTDNSNVADSQGVDHQDGSGGTPGESNNLRIDTSNLASDGENSAAEEVDIDVSSNDVTVEKMEVDNGDASGGSSSVEDRTSRDTKTALIEELSKSLADAAIVAPDVSAKHEKGEGDSTVESETKLSIFSAEAIPDVDPNIPDAVMEVTTSTQSEQDVCRTPSKVVTIEIGKKAEDEKKEKEEEIKPTSFQFVKAKMMAGYYKSVDKFCKDCVIIFQASFNQETELIPGLSKSNVVAKSAFLKIMTQMFPWFNVEETKLWTGEERYQENGVLQVAVEPPHKDHEYAQWRHRALMPSITAQPSPFKKLPTPRRRHSIIGGDGGTEDPHVTTLDDLSDPRRCCLCGVMGDDDANNAGRLLYCGQDEWIHINCALWSAEVFEEVDGSLINVHAAISRGRMMRCEVCNNLGATVGCCSRGCPANFHFMCARSRNAMFQEDKKVYCFQHADKIDKAIMGSDLFGVLRRVCVSLDNMKPNRTFSQGLEAKNINVMIGSWSLESLGHLGFLSDVEKALFPLEFACSRVYWSTVDPCRRCIYTMRIIEVNPLTSPTTPQEVNHTTEHSPGSYSFSRKPTLQDDDDTDMLADALMEATKESNEAAMALDQVAALLAGSQTVSEIQNAADALAATSSLFEMDDGVLDSLNLDGNLNSGLDSDGIMDIMADLDNLDNLNPDGALGVFPDSTEKFLQSDKAGLSESSEKFLPLDKPVSHPEDDSATLSMDDILPAVSVEAQEESKSTPQTDTKVDVPSSEEQSISVTVNDSEDKPGSDTVKESEYKPGSPCVTMGTEERHEKVITADEEAESKAESTESLVVKDKVIATVETSCSAAVSNISVSLDEYPDVTRPDSPLMSPKKVPYVKLVDIKDKQLASAVTPDSAAAADTSMPLYEYPNVTRPDSPLISPKKMPMLKLVKLPLEQHEKSYPESDDGSSEAPSETSRNTTPCPGGRDSLDDSQTSGVLSTGVSPLPNQSGSESTTNQALTLPTVSISPSEEWPARERPTNKSSEAFCSDIEEDMAISESSDISVLSAKSREGKGTYLASNVSEEPEVTKDLPDEIKEIASVGINFHKEQKDNTKAERTETDSTQSFVPESSNEQPCEESPSNVTESANAGTIEFAPSKTPAEPEMQDVLSQKDESLELIAVKITDTAFPGPIEEQRMELETTSREQLQSDDEVVNLDVASLDVDKTKYEGKTSEDEILARVELDCPVKTTPAEPEKPSADGRVCLDEAEDEADGHGLQVKDISKCRDAMVRIEEKQMTDIPTRDATQAILMASCQDPAEKTEPVDSHKEKETKEESSLRTNSCIPSQNPTNEIDSVDHQEDFNMQHIEPRFSPGDSECPPTDENDKVNNLIEGENGDTNDEEANLLQVPHEEQQESILTCVGDIPTQSPVELDGDEMVVSTESLNSALSHQVEIVVCSPGKTSADCAAQFSTDVKDDNVDKLEMESDSLGSHAGADVSKQSKGLGSQDASHSSSPNTRAADQEENTIGESMMDDAVNINISALPDDICQEVKDVSSDDEDVSSDDEVKTVQSLGELDPDVASSESLDPKSLQSPHHILREDTYVVGSAGHIAPRPETNEIVDTIEATSSLPVEFPSNIHQDSSENIDQSPTADDNAADLTVVIPVAEDSKNAENSVPSREIVSVGSPKSCPTSLDNEASSLLEAPVEQDNDLVMENIEPSIISESSTGPDSTCCVIEPSIDCDISTTAPDPFENEVRNRESNSQERTEGTQVATDLSLADADSHFESLAPEDKETVIMNEEKCVLEAGDQARNYDTRDNEAKVASKVSPGFESLTEELRMQGVGEEDIMTIIASHTQQLSNLSPDAAISLESVEDTPARRLSSDPEHESIFKALATSLSSSITRKNNNNRKSPRRQEREPILSAFASDLNSRHYKNTPEKDSVKNDLEQVEHIVSPTTSKNIFKKLDNPKFASAFKAFMETKKKSVSSVVDELLDKDLVSEQKNSGDASSKDKRRRSSRLGSADSFSPERFHNVLQNGDDSLIASYLQNSDQSKRRTRHSSSDVLESDDSSSKIEVVDVGHQGRKKYPMRTTSSRLLRIADSEDLDNQVFPPEEDVEEDDERMSDKQKHEGQEDDKSSLTRKPHESFNEGRRRLSSDDGLRSPRSSSRRKSHQAIKQDNFIGDQEEKENEAIKRSSGRARKSTDAMWSPEKESAALNHIEAEEVEGRPMRTRGLSRKPSLKMKEIIAAELEGEEGGDAEEIGIQKKGRGRPRKFPVPDQVQVHHISAVEVVKPRGRGRPRKYPSLDDMSITEQSLARDQNEARKRDRDSNSDDHESLEKGKLEEESMPKRKRGRPRLYDKHPGQDQFVDIDGENNGDDSNKRTRGESTSTSDEEHHDQEQGLPRLRTRSLAKRLKPGDHPVETEDAILDSTLNVGSQSEDRQVHPRKQSVVARSFPGDDTQSGTQSTSSKGLLSDSSNVSKQHNILPNNELIMHGDAAITPEVNPIKQVEETPDSSSQIPTPKKQVRVTVRIDPLTGAISEVLTGIGDEPMEVDTGLNDPSPSQAPPVEASPAQSALPSQTPWVSDLNNSGQQWERKVYNVQSNLGNRKVIIGKDVTTNEVIYANGPTSVRNPIGGPRFRGPSTLRYQAPPRNTTRQARTRGPFSRSSQVLWQGTTANLKPCVTSQRIPNTPVGAQQAIANRPGVSPYKVTMGAGSVPRQSISLTGQPISSLLPNTVPGVLSSPGTSFTMNSRPRFQSSPQSMLVVTTIGSPNVISVVTTSAGRSTPTSTAQEQYLSILQRTYQASQLQQVNALAGIMPQSYPQQGLLQGFGVTSPEMTPFVNQANPNIMASPTLQTLQTIIQQAGVQSSMTPGVQPLSPSPTPVFPVSPLMPTSPMDTSLSSLITSLSPPIQQQPVGAQLAGFTEATSSLFHQEHMYARQKSGSKRRKSPHQVKVWFDSYGSLKNEDENQEGTENEIPGPSLIKVPSVRMKNASNMPRARVKNPTFGADDNRSNKTILKLSKKKSKSINDSSPSWKTNASLDPFSGLSTDDAFFAAMPNLGQSDHHDDSPSLLLTLMEQEKRRGPSTTPRRPSNRPHLMFEIRSDDGFETRAESIDEAWGRVVERVGELRTNTRRKHLSFDGVKGMKMIGITHEAIIFLLEQLYGAGNCHNYKFKFHKHEDTAEDDEPPVNPHGCARAEVFKRTSTYDIFNFLASHHRNRPIFNELEQPDESSDIQHKSSRRATSLQDLPMAMRFRHLKQTAKEAVGVYRSGIHGRGLFCRRLIEAGEMVIEYSGTVVRSILTDKREKYYESKGIGCYMFRIDDFDVVDATTHGNAARFINHSCDSNCFSRVIEVGGQKHIIIFASRRIAMGEELTYDYKFPIEEVKIPCNCGSRKCRKYLN